VSSSHYQREGELAFTAVVKGGRGPMAEGPFCRESLPYPYGTSPNAVKTQVWIAICIYVLVAIIRKELNVEHSLHEILQILSVSLFGL
jgi:hypothetical protein